MCCAVDVDVCAGKVLVDAEECRVVTFNVNFGFNPRYVGWGQGRTRPDSGGTVGAISCAVFEMPLVRNSPMQLRTLCGRPVF